MTEAPRRRSLSRPMIIVGALSLVALLAELGYQTTAVAALPYFLRTILNLQGWGLSLVISAFLIAETLGKIPFGSMSDRYGRRPFVVAGPLLSALAVFTLTQVPRILDAGLEPGQAALFAAVAVTLLRALDGLGAAMLWPTLFATIADVVDERVRASAMSLFNLSYIGGLVIGPLLYSGVFARTGSHTAIFYVLGTSFLMCVVVALIATPGRKAGAQMSTPAPASGNHAPGASAWTIIRHSPILLAMLFVAVVQFIGLHTLNGVLSIYLKEQIGITEVMFGRLFVYIGLVVGVVALPMGRLADRMGKPEAMRLGLGICAVGLWILPWVHAMGLLVLTAGIFGLGFMLASPAWLALMTELAGEERRGGVVGIMNTAQGVGASLGALLSFPLYDRVGPRAPFLVSAFLFTISVLIVFQRVTPERAQGNA